MANVRRQIRIEVAAEVGCDERLVIKIIDGGTAKAKAVQVAIEVALRARGCTKGEGSVWSDGAPPAATAPAPESQRTAAGG